MYFRVPSNSTFFRHPPPDQDDLSHQQQSVGGNPTEEIISALLPLLSSLQEKLQMLEEAVNNITSGTTSWMTTIEQLLEACEQMQSAATAQDVEQHLQHYEETQPESADWADQTDSVDETGPTDFSMHLQQILGEDSIPDEETVAFDFLVMEDRPGIDDFWND